VLHQGFGSSPTVYESLVLVTADNKGTGVIAAFERSSGNLVWRQPRPQLPNYASPIIYNISGRDQLFVTGCDLVSSFDPRSGKKLWEIPGSTTETVTSTVTDGQHIFISGGYPKGHVAAVRADGSGKVAWESSVKVYVPSMLQHRGYLYAVTDQGVALCLKCDTGKEVWKGRIDGQFTASPVLVGEHIYATSEVGRTFIFQASPDAFTMVADNQLPGEVLASPTICGNRIYLRIGTRQDGRRQEMLYCLGTGE
jgi:outer membrane protein assembly factor BamB